MKKTVIDEDRSRISREILEAIQRRDTAKLRELKDQVRGLDFLSKYITEDGTGDVPPESWLELNEALLQQSNGEEGNK